jgi:alkylation response protein AidB-like acyl-CoA dehydrogenase
MGGIELSPAQAEFQRGFAGFCRERIAPRAREADRGGHISAATWQDLAAVGYLGLFHPVARGGSGADAVTLAIAMESLARACASTFWSASISTSLCGKFLDELCRPSHHQRWLAPIARGERLGCFAATEDGAGSDPASYQTRVERHGRGYRLVGQKSRVANAPAADVAVVLARADGAAGDAGGLCYVVVDLHQPTIHRSALGSLGLRAMPWGNLVFDGVAVEDEDVIQGIDMDITLRVVEWGQCIQSLCALGVAEAALEECMTHVRGRRAFQGTLSDLDGVQARLVDMRAEIDAARLLTWEALAVKGEGRAARELIVMAKIYATEMAVRVADSSMRLMGGWGYSTVHEIERLYRDSLANVPAGLPTDRLRELLVCPLLGISPWTYDHTDWLTPAGLTIAP